jgi:hypothetical protein
MNSALAGLGESTSAVVGRTKERLPRYPTPRRVTRSTFGRGTACSLGSFDRSPGGPVVWKRAEPARLASGANYEREAMIDHNQANRNRRQGEFGNHERHVLII